MKLTNLNTKKFLSVLEEAAHICSLIECESNFAYCNKDGIQINNIEGLLSYYETGKGVEQRLVGEILNSFMDLIYIPPTLLLTALAYKVKTGRDIVFNEPERLNSLSRYSNFKEVEQIINKIGLNDKVTFLEFEGKEPKLMEISDKKDISLDLYFGNTSFKEAVIIPIITPFGLEFLTAMLESIKPEDNELLEKNIIFLINGLPNRETETACKKLGIYNKNLGFGFFTTETFPMKKIKAELSGIIYSFVGYPSGITEALYKNRTTQVSIGNKKIIFEGMKSITKSVMISTPNRFLGSLRIALQRRIAHLEGMLCVSLKDFIKDTDGAFKGYAKNILLPNKPEPYTYYNITRKLYDSYKTYL